MKFSVTSTTLATTLLFATASAGDSNLRSVATQPTDAKKGDNDRAKARLMITGLLHETSSEDRDIISKSVVSTYNKVFSTYGFQMDTFDTTFVAPFEAAKDIVEASPVGIGEILNADSLRWYIPAWFCPPPHQICCRWCLNDDDYLTGELTVTATKLSETHEDFETSLCDMIRKSGAENLSNVKDCSFAFLETAGVHQATVPSISEDPLFYLAEVEESGDEEGDEKAMAQIEAQVTMKGVIHEYGAEDRTVMDASIQNAFNDAFLNAGYKLGSFEAFNDINMNSMDKLIFARVEISKDGLKTLDADDEAMLAFMHAAFEKGFCNKLQKSGQANLANVHDCTFRFVYQPTAVMKDAVTSPELSTTLPQL